jgi:large subunit ribosomal protein L3
MNAIIGKKIGMSRIFDEAGNTIPVTLILAQKNIVTQVKNEDKDGYATVQIGISEDHKINQPLTGHLKKVKTKTKTLKEFNLSDVNIGDELNLDQFEKDDIVSVSGVSKGKGFAGTVKRHNFATGPKTHGSDNYRHPGSIGSMYPQRVIKGRRMAGHMGFDKVTLRSVKIAQILNDEQIIMLEGAIPGPNKSTIYIWK